MYQPVLKIAVQSSRVSCSFLYIVAVTSLAVAIASLFEPAATVTLRLCATVAAVAEAKPLEPAVVMTRLPLPQSLHQSPSCSSSKAEASCAVRSASPAAIQ